MSKELNDVGKLRNGVIGAGALAASIAAGKAAVKYLGSKNNNTKEIAHWGNYSINKRNSSKK